MGRIVMGLYGKTVPEVSYTPESGMRMPLTILVSLRPLKTSGKTIATNPLGFSMNSILILLQRSGYR